MCAFVARAVSHRPPRRIGISLFAFALGRRSLIFPARCLDVASTPQFRIGERIEIYAYLSVSYSSRAADTEARDLL